MDNQTLNILLIEDDSVDVMNVQRAFKKSNINNPLFIARNGLEALEMLRNPEGDARIPYPRVILLDLNQPKLNGIEFLKELRSDEELKKTGVFVMTTSNDEKDISDAYHHNVSGYIVKPLSFEQFVHTITTLNNFWNLCIHPS